MDFDHPRSASFLLALVVLTITNASCTCENGKCSIAGQDQSGVNAGEDTSDFNPAQQGDEAVKSADEQASNPAVALRAGGPRPTTPRIEPVKQESWTDAQKELLAPFAQSGRLYNVFTTMANYPDLARDWLTFGAHVLRRNSLPPRDREILILRIGWLCRAEYEWAQHVPIGKSVGLSDEDIRRIGEGPSAEGLAEHDRLLLQAVDELRSDACLADATWDGLAKSYSTQQMMDLVFTVGQYNLVSMALNSFGVQLDEGLRGFRK
jgi:4-carboxymuconolactone decarboxylase